jgi:hypothetical protein
MMNTFRACFLLLPLLLLVACGGENIKVTNTSSSASAAETVTDLFASQEPSATGIGFVNSVEVNEKLNYVNYAYIFNGGGVAMLDFD